MAATARDDDWWGKVPRDEWGYPAYTYNQWQQMRGVSEVPIANLLDPPQSPTAAAPRCAGCAETDSYPRMDEKLWEQRRWEASVRIMGGLAANGGNNFDMMADTSVLAAASLIDAYIKEYGDDGLRGVKGGVR